MSHLFVTLDEKMIGVDVQVISMEIFLFTNEILVVKLQLLFILWFDCLKTHTDGENTNLHIKDRVIGGKAKCPSLVKRIYRVISIK